MGYNDEKQVEVENLLSGYQSEFSFDDVDITDDLMFAHVMQHKNICIGLLEQLFPGRKIRDIKYYSVEDDEPIENQAETQVSLRAEFDKRGIRLDVFFDDGKTVYNVEMQTTKQAALPKRARTYQAYIDSNQLMRGVDFDKLKESYVIFICKFDPFEKGWSRYSFSNRCDDDPAMQLGDDSYKLFFNTKGNGAGIDKALLELLTYMNDTKAFPVETTENSLIKNIDRAVSLARQNDEWRRNYMTMRVQERSAELRGIDIGVDKNRIESLYALMSRKGWPFDEAFDTLGYPMSEKEKYRFEVQRYKPFPTM